MPETLYPRNRMLAQAPMHREGEEGPLDMEKIGRRRSNADISNLPRTKQLPFVNFKPVPGLKHPRPWDSMLRFGVTFKLLAVVIAVLTYCFMWYWWVLSVITMLPAAYVQYTPLIQGLLFIGLLLGTLSAEILIGGRLSDIMVARLAKKNGGMRIPEQRLWLAYPAGILTAVGLIIWGVSIDKGYHWMVGQVAFFLFAAGIQVGNTVIVAYVVDAYPLQSMAMVTFYAVFLNLSAFINPVSKAAMSMKCSLTSHSSSSPHGRHHLAGRGALRRRASLLPSEHFLSLRRCRDSARLYDRSQGRSILSTQSLMPRSRARQFY